MQKCCLSEKAKFEHAHANPAYTTELYRVGCLLEGRQICLWCLLHLQDLVRPAVNESDVYHLQELKRKFPNLWQLVEEVGIDVMRRELGMTWLAVCPSSLPIRPEQTPSYPTLKVTMKSARGDMYGT